MSPEIELQLLHNRYGGVCQVGTRFVVGGEEQA